jgi:hypothetical protein
MKGSQLLSHKLTIKQHETNNPWHLHMWGSAQEKWKIRKEVGQKNNYVWNILAPSKDQQAGNNQINRSQSY